MSASPSTPHGTPPRPRRWLAKLGVSLGTLLVLALAGELVGRLAGFGSTPQFLEVGSHRYLQMVPLPNQEQLVGIDDPATGEYRVPMRINAYGQRGADYALEKQPGELRLIGLGDSLTFGRGVGTDETYLALLGQSFEERPASHPAGVRVRVVNASFNGYGSYHYEQWARSQLERFQPDLLLVGLFSGNDMEPVAPYRHGAWFDLERQSALRRMLISGYNKYLWKRVRAWRRDQSLEQVDAELDDYRGIGAGGPRRQQVLDQWSVSMGHLRGIRAVGEAHGVPVVCVLIPTSWMTAAEQEPPFYGWLREQVDEVGLPVIDLLPILREVELGAGGPDREPSAPWLSFDAGHLNVDGHRAAARAVRVGLADLGLLD